MKLLKALCWILLALTLLAVVVMVVRPSLATQAGAAQTGFLLLFVILHAWLGYTARGMAAFVVIAGVVSFTLEAISIATGFPFGSYTHHLPGLKPLGVPLVALAGWIMFSWLAWALARLIMRPVACMASVAPNALRHPSWQRSFSGAMTLSNDPVGATAHNWYSYDHPTGALGVPLTNYLGWLLTGWLIFQLVALIEPRFPGRPVTQGRAYWLLPCLFWLSTTAQVFNSLIHPTDGVVVRGGKTIVIADVYESCASAALFTVVFTGITALIRLYSRPPSQCPPNPLSRWRGAAFTLPTCDTVVTLSVSRDFKHHRLETARCGARRVRHAPLTMGASPRGDLGLGYVFCCANEGVGR